MTEKTIDGNIKSANRNEAGGSYAPVNGLQLYYEVHGSDTGEKPLVLLHGGLGTVDMFAQILPAFAETRRIIAVELQGHGHTADVDRPLSFESMADDMAALMGHLGLENADFLGYSLGGGVALQTAIRHPHVVHKLVLISTVYKRDGWYPEALAGMAAMNAEVAQAMVGTPIHDAYIRAAPNPEDWPRLVTGLGMLLKQDYDWTAGVAEIRAPILIVAGDTDGMRFSHVVEMFALLGGGKPNGGMGAPIASQLAVLPATTHLSILTRSQLLIPMIESFLDTE